MVLIKGITMKKLVALWGIFSLINATENLGEFTTKESADKITSYALYITNKLDRGIWGTYTSTQQQTPLCLQQIGGRMIPFCNSLAMRDMSFFVYGQSTKRISVSTIGENIPAKVVVNIGTATKNLILDVPLLI